MFSVYSNPQYMVFHTLCCEVHKALTSSSSSCTPYAWFSLLYHLLKPPPHPATKPCFGFLGCAGCISGCVTDSTHARPTHGILSWVQKAREQVQRAYLDRGQLDIGQALCWWLYQALYQTLSNQEVGHTSGVIEDNTTPSCWSFGHGQLWNDGEVHFNEVHFKQLHHE